MVEVIVYILLHLHHAFIIVREYGLDYIYVTHLIMHSAISYQLSLISLLVVTFLISVILSFSLINLLLILHISNLFHSLIFKHLTLLYLSSFVMANRMKSIGH